MKDTISALASWRFWMGSSLRLSKIYGMRFPDDLYKWNKFFPVCPVCNSARSFYVEEIDDDVLCICEIAHLHEQIEEWNKYATYISPARLEDLRPFIYNDPEKGPNLKGKEDLEFYKRKLYEWKKDLRRWILVEGGVGSGKTHSFRAIKTWFPELTLFVSMDTFQSNIHKFMNDGTLKDMLHALSIAPILIIDDLGAEHDTAFVNNLLFRVVNSRYNQKPENYITIMSTNLSIREMIEGSDLARKRIMSRMVDKAYSDTFILRQNDFRVVQKQVTYA